MRFAPSGGNALSLARGDPQPRDIDHAWRSTLHAARARAMARDSANGSAREPWWRLRCASRQRGAMLRTTTGAGGHDQVQSDCPLVTRRGHQHRRSPGRISGATPTTAMRGRRTPSRPCSRTADGLGPSRAVTLGPAGRRSVRDALGKRRYACRGTDRRSRSRRSLST